MKNWPYTIILLVMCACGNQNHDNAYGVPLPYDSTCTFNSKYMMVELQSLNYDSFVNAIHYVFQSCFGEDYDKEEASKLNLLIEEKLFPNRSKFIEGEFLIDAVDMKTRSSTADYYLSSDSISPRALDWKRIYYYTEESFELEVCETTVDFYLRPCFSNIKQGESHYKTITYGDLLPNGKRQPTINYVKEFPCSLDFAIEVSFNRGQTKESREYHIIRLKDAAKLLDTFGPRKRFLTKEI